MMNTSSALPTDLNLRLQEKLDALIQSPAAFAKFVAQESNSNNDIANPDNTSSSNSSSDDIPQLPSIVPESGDESSSDGMAYASTADIPTFGSAHPIDHSSSDNESDVESMKSNSGSSYKDYSRVLPPNQTESSLLSSSHQPTSTTTAKEPTFTVKLHMILSNPEFDDIIAWLPHGRSWRILQQKAFEERVIPLYFRHGRYSSFARQVNGWGFRRVTHGSDYNSYYHELFLRGMPHLCDRMRRLTSKDTASRKKAEEDPAPDFYALSRENPLPKAPPAPVAEKQSAQPQQQFGGIFDVEQALMLNRPGSTASSIANLLGPNGFNGINQMQGGLQNLQQMMVQQQQQLPFPGGNMLSNPLQGLPGLQNASGLSGLQNASGLSGLQNASGLSGLQNAGGLAGLQNAGGLAGLQNAGGLAGLQNASGLAGLQNASGLAGLQNASGLAGLQNAGGLAGLQNTGFFGGATAMNPIMTMQASNNMMVMPTAGSTGASPSPTIMQQQMQQLLTPQDNMAQFLAMSNPGATASLVGSSFNF